MSSKIVKIEVPNDADIPDISSFTLEENYLILKIGYECMIESRKSVIALTQIEIHDKIKEEYKEEIEKLELDLMVERETQNKMKEYMSKMYEGQIESLKNQLMSYEYGNKDIIVSEIEKVRDKYDLLLQEKEKQVNRLTDIHEKILIQNNKSLSHKGSEGEKQFNDYAETFVDFTGFKLINKSKQSHTGDFHLFFQDFNVLVDVKNYNGYVTKKEIEKIESDLRVNGDMKFAWLISLYSNISEWSRFPIMNKWINTDSGLKCIIFINNLTDAKDPKSVLRLAWYICNEFNKITQKMDDMDNLDLTHYKEKELILINQIKNLQKRNNEMRRSMNMSLAVLKSMDKDLLDMLSLLSNEIVNNESEKSKKILEWFEINTEYIEDENSKLTSTDLWNKFKKDNRDYIIEEKVTIDYFKEILIKQIGNINCIEKTKGGLLEIKNYKFVGELIKMSELETKIKEKVMKNNLDKSESILENVDMFSQDDLLNGKNIKKKVKTGKKDTKTIEYYLDEKIDKEVIDYYGDMSNNIISISEKLTIPVYKVVSILVRHKIINKRVDARGYSDYKNTDEYKSKLETK